MVGSATSMLEMSQNHTLIEPKLTVMNEVTLRLLYPLARLTALL